MNLIKHMLNDIRLEYRNCRGKKVDKKYLIIESDDWGSIRQPSQEVYKKQMERGLALSDDPFFCFDSLERNRDMESLFEVLDKYRDRHGNHPIITANYAVANPDYPRIRQSDFQKYYYESFSETRKRYPYSDQIISISKQGVEAGVWMPQLHCREHLQIGRWMQALRDGDPEIIWAFENQMISTTAVLDHKNRYGYMDAFNYATNEADIIFQIIYEAVGLFEKIFSFPSETFVASCYVWNQALERALKKNGIVCMQGGWYQWVPSETMAGQYVKRVHYNGEKSIDQCYLVRNCLLEHSLFGVENCVENCLKQIESAFRWKQPAIIGSHRVNYIGRMVAANGEHGIRVLDALLRRVLAIWPDVEFISSDKLANIYLKGGT